MTPLSSMSRSRVMLLFFLTALGLAYPSLARAALIQVGEPGTSTVGLALAEQDRGGVDIRYGMESFGLEPVMVQGRSMQSVTLSGGMLPNDAGAPNLPGKGCFVAVPQGATVYASIVSSQTRSYYDIDIAPAPPLPPDGSDDPLIYEMDTTIYRRNAFYPAHPFIVSPPRTIRGVDVVMVGITPFQYNPVTRELRVYTALDVRVEFEGGTGGFGDPRLRSRYWEPLLRDHLINYESVAAAPGQRLMRETAPGAEYLIITPDDSVFVAWADTLKNWRQLQGISTKVVTLGEIGLSSPWAIESYINNAYATWDPAPAAFLLLGDYPVAGGVGIPSPLYDNYCVSDNIYADVDGDHLPDLAHGRICANDEAQLSTMIGKMLDYERHPVTDASFYDSPVISGGFQLSRWFILCAEVIRGHQVERLGKNPRREYAVYTGVPDSVWSDGPNTDEILAYFGPGGLGYIPEEMPPLDWNGSATRINADLNSGAYMILHRDHGTLTGWGEPRYRNLDLDGLTTTQPPFVFSMNCETGRYNATAESFAEKFHRLSTGALGLIAASQTSFSFVNDVYTWGVFDGLWPDFDPYYGETQEANLRTAFAQVSGKYYLAASGWPYNDYDKRVTYHLFHHHGDAFLTLYSEMPESLSVSHPDHCFLDTSTFTMQADSGAVIGLTVKGNIVGVADATGLPQDITIKRQAHPGTLRITVTKANHFRYDRSVPIIPDVPRLFLAASEIYDAVGDSLSDTHGNADGNADAGERIEWALTLANDGTQPATQVTATLSSADPLVEILDAAEVFEDIPVDSMRRCLDAFELEIAPHCPDQHALVFDLHVQSAEGSWAEACTLSVHAPVLALVGCAVDDSLGGNGNGRLDPGETVFLAPRLTNVGSEMATGLDLELHLFHPSPRIEEGKATLDTLRCAQEIYLPGGFQVSLDSAATVPDVYVGEFSCSGDWGLRQFLRFELEVGGFFDDMESGGGRWDSLTVTPDYVNQWHLSSERNHTPGGGVSWKFGDASGGAYADLADGALVSEPVPLNDSCELRFFHWMQAQVDSLHPGLCIDGGMVELSVNDGPWMELQPEGGYPYQISSDDSLAPFLEGTPVYSGTHDWEEAVFIVNGYSGFARFRFRFGSDSAEGFEGWFIDDVEFFGRTNDPSSPDEAAPVILNPMLLPNHPNPFDRWTLIAFELPAGSEVSVRVFDVTGRMVRSLVDGRMGAGMHAIRWDGCDANGVAVPSGIYFCRLEAAGARETRKMVVAE